MRSVRGLHRNLRHMPTFLNLGDIKKMLMSFQGYGILFKIFKRNMIYHGPSFQGLLDRFPRLVIKDLILLVHFCDCKEGGV